MYLEGVLYRLLMIIGQANEGIVFVDGWHAHWNESLLMQRESIPISAKICYQNVTNMSHQTREERMKEASEQLELQRKRTC